MKREWKLGTAIGVIMALVMTQVILASSVDEAIVDTTVPTSSVTLMPGGSGAITINLTVTGNQVGTATLDVYRDWTLSGGTFTGSNPQTFAVPPRAAQDASTTFSTSGTVTVAAGQATGTFTLAVGAFNITNSNQTGAKLAAGQSSSYQVTVSAPANTAPSVSVTGVTNGASYEIGSVPAATCEVTDAEDGNSSFDPTLSAVSGSLADYGLGEQTASCSYTDAGGLTASASVTYYIVDTTNPVITFVSRTPANGYGWNNDDVTVEWSCTDSRSGVVAASVSQTVSAEGANQSATGTCEDHAGNTASDTQTGINIDKTAPTASASASPAANANGWNKTDVTVSFSGTDGLSGIASCTAEVVLTAQAPSQSASGTCTDKAGNVSAPASASGINIDKTAPVVTVTGVTNGATYTLGSVPVAGCDTTDALSGVATPASLSSSGGPVGSITATCSGAIDNAGNANSASVTYSVIYNWAGFFQPVDNNVLNRVKAGSAIPIKFSLGGNQGLTIFEAGYPKVSQITCDVNAPVDDIESTVTSGASSLTYDATANQYVYVWKTDKAWATTCRALAVKLIDGTTHYAYFTFTK